MVGWGGGGVEQGMPAETKAAERRTHVSHKTVQSTFNQVHPVSVTWLWQTRQ